MLERESGGIGNIAKKKADLMLVRKIPEYHNQAPKPEDSRGYYRVSIIDERPRSFEDWRIRRYYVIKFRI